TRRSSDLRDGDAEDRAAVGVGAAGGGGACDSAGDRGRVPDELPGFHAGRLRGLLMVTNAIARDYDIARMLEEYRRRIEYLERRVTQLPPVELDTARVSVAAAPGLPADLEDRPIGHVVVRKGTPPPHHHRG